MAGTLRIQKQSITEMAVDCIVNAANSQFRQGGGVCGVIFASAGASQLQAACDALGHCPTGEAVITPGFKLKAKYIVHAIGPIWQGGSHGEAAALAACYRSCLDLARAHGIDSVDFPSISTGVYGYPMAQAASVALKVIMDDLRTHDHPCRVRMVCHTEDAASIYRQTYNLWYAETKEDRL